MITMKTKNRDQQNGIILNLKILLLGSLLTACDNGSQPPQATATGPSEIETSGLPSELFVAEPPTDALDVVAARQNAQPGADIVIQGFVGGRADPFVDGRAVLTLADAPALETCDQNPDDGCQTPWDACCEAPAKIKASIATVQVVDADGNVLKQGLKGTGGIVEQSMLTIKGLVAAGSSPDSLVVNASKIYVDSTP